MTPTQRKALDLLAQGHSKTEVAQRCGVSRRTIIRWSQKSDNAATIQGGENLIEEASAAVARLGIEHRINDLLEYRDEQRSLAVGTGQIAASLLPVCHQLISYLHQNPSELSPRILPQLIKAISEVARASSDCWARATGIDERIRSEIKVEVDELRDVRYLIRQASGNEVLERLVQEIFPQKEEE